MSDISDEVLAELNTGQVILYLITDWVFALALMGSCVVFIVGAIGAVIGYSLPIDWGIFIMAIVGILVTTGLIQFAFVAMVMD